MQIQAVLYSQGFGTRRQCAELVLRGAVRIGGSPCEDPAADVAEEGLRFSVDGVEWAYHARATLMLHKPAGVECSQKPGQWPSVYSLLPAPLRRRPSRGGTPGVQAVGRLDQDTTGLLLLTDDGALLHRLTSPRHHVAKVYEVTLAEPVDGAMLQRLRDGVVLKDDPEPVRAAAVEATGPCALRLTLTEGRYHQVKRMVAAAGGHVAALHRSRFGSLTLPPDLAPGEYVWLTNAQIAALESPLPSGERVG